MAAHVIVNNTASDIIIALASDKTEKVILHKFLDDTGKLQMVQGDKQLQTFEEKLTVPASEPAKKGSMFVRDQPGQERQLGELRLNAEDMKRVRLSSSYKQLMESGFITERMDKDCEAPASVFES